MDDIPIYIDGEEVVERPRFTDEFDLGAYLTRIAEDRELTLVVAHPHDDESDVLGIYVGSLENAPACPHGCEY